MSRRSAVLTILLLGGVVLLSAVPTWISGTTISALGPQIDLDVPGTQAAPGVMAAGLALLASGVACGLVGRLGRWIVVLVVVLASVVIVGSAIGAVVNPRGPALAAAAEETGVASLLTEPGVTVWPWVALVLGVAGVALSTGIGRGSKTWRITSSRHERVQTRVQSSSTVAVEGSSNMDSDQADLADLWDAQTRGDAD